MLAQKQRRTHKVEATDEMKMMMDEMEAMEARMSHKMDAKIVALESRMIQTIEYSVASRVAIAVKPLHQEIEKLNQKVELLSNQVNSLKTKQSMLQTSLKELAKPVYQSRALEFQPVSLDQYRALELRFDALELQLNQLQPCGCPSLWRKIETLIGQEFGGGPGGGGNDECSGKRQKTQ